jgi:hypothetical protein
MTTLNDLQKRVLRSVSRGLNGHKSITGLGALYKSTPGKRGDPTIGRLAAHSISKALERRGLVMFFRSPTGDQWASLMVALTDEGRAELASNEGPKQEAAGPLGVQPKPCGSCPYRRDVPAGVWAPEEYSKLREFDRPTGDQPLSLFMCHTSPNALCAGWVGCHEKRRGHELIALTLGVLTGRVDPAVRRFVTRVPLFKSGTAAAEHGLSGVQRPSLAARGVVDKLTRARRLMGRPVRRG